MYFLLGRKVRHEVIGDLVEEYAEEVLPKFGRRSANLWFWKQTIGSVFAMMPSRLLKFFAFRWLFDYVKHMLSGLLS